MKNLSQQELLAALKEALGLTWEEVAALTKIQERTLKSYRLPGTSKGSRKMGPPTREKIERLVRNARKRVLKNH